MLSVPSTEKAMVLDKRGEWAAYNETPSMEPIWEARAVPRSIIFLRGKTGSGTNFSRAAVKPTVAGEVFGPAGRSFSCAAPERVGAGRSCGRETEGPATL